jgi:hypothetical protein
MFKIGDVTIFRDHQHGDPADPDVLLKRHGERNLGTILGDTKITNGVTSYKLIYKNLADIEQPEGFVCWMSEKNLVLYQSATPDWEI